MSLKTDSALIVKKLSFAYDDTFLFSGVEFELSSGEVLQVLGENGRGKTTLLRILAGLLDPSEGTVFWKGQPVKHSETYFKDLIYLGHSLGLKPHLKVRESLCFSARLRGYALSQQRLLGVLEQVGLASLAEKPTGELSAGQRLRLALARLLASPSRLWILDEPFSVLSQKAQLWLSDLILEFLAQRGSVIFTSHHSIHALKPSVVRVFAL